MITSCGQNSSFFVTVSVWSKLKCFSSHGAIGLCDCVSVVNTQEFQFPLCYLGLNDNFVTASVVRTQVFQFLWCYVGLNGKFGTVCGKNSSVSGPVVLFRLER